MEQSLSLSVPEAVQQFIACIKISYIERNIGGEDELLCHKSEKLVRLELVESERMQTEEEKGKKETRTPLEYADIFKVESGKRPIRKVLVDGDAGMGKTTFCTAVSEKWAKGEILNEFELLLLLPLREQEVASAGCLIELLKFLHPSNKICDLVKEYIEEGKGKFLVIADGWDELNEENRKKGSFLYKVLFSPKYHSMSTLVTSRPSASAPLHVGNCID